MEVRRSASSLLLSKPDRDGELGWLEVENWCSVRPVPFEELATVVHSGAVGVQHAVAEDGGAKVGEQPVAVEAVHRRL
jgi:hypothetical protein